MPARHDIPILKDRFFKNPSKNLILAAQAFRFRGDKYLTKKVRVVSLIYASTKYYQNISNHSEVMKCTRIGLRNSFRGFNLKKEQSYCPSCM